MEILPDTTACSTWGAKPFGSFQNSSVTPTGRNPPEVFNECNVGVSIFSKLDSETRAPFQPNLAILACSLSQFPKSHVVNLLELVAKEYPGILYLIYSNGIACTINSHDILGEKFVRAIGR